MLNYSLGARSHCGRYQVIRDSDFTQAFDYAIFYSGDASVNPQFEEAPSDLDFALGGSK